MWMRDASARVNALSLFLGHEGRYSKLETEVRRFVADARAIVIVYLSSAVNVGTSFPPTVRIAYLPLSQSRSGRRTLFSPESMARIT